MSQEYINPSVGIIGMPYFDFDNNRIKYFSTTIHTNIESIESLFEQCQQMMGQSRASRINARFFTQGLDVNTLENVEAVMHMGGLDLICLGYNTEDRRDSQEVVQQENNLINNVLETQASRRDIPEIYTVELIDETCNLRDISDMVKLYSEAFTTYTTNLNHVSVSHMVDNSWTYVVRHNGRVVSTVVAEIADVNLDNGNTIRIAELSEMATLRDYRGQGLVTYATQQLLDDLNDVNLIYAEARASHFAINRTFRRLGFEYAGRLNKQCILSGDQEINEQGPYENLNVWYIAR